MAKYHQKMKNLKHILSETAPDEVLLTSWLVKQGADRSVLHDYKKRGLLKSIGTGAVIRTGREPTLDACLNALETQAGYDIHIGGYSALSRFHGAAHFIRAHEKTTLFSQYGRNLPSWFLTSQKDAYKWIRTDFLDTSIGIETQPGPPPLAASCAERAFLELLYGVPNKTSTREAYQMLELLPTLRPSVLNPLLDACRSKRVKRLFFFMAKRIGHVWFAALKKQDLGAGVRVIDKGGTWDAEFGLVIDNVGSV